MLILCTCVPCASYSETPWFVVGRSCHHSRSVPGTDEPSESMADDGTSSMADEGELNIMLQAHVEEVSLRILQVVNLVSETLQNGLWPSPNCPCRDSDCSKKRNGSAKHYILSERTNQPTNQRTNQPTNQPTNRKESRKMAPYLFCSTKSALLLTNTKPTKTTTHGSVPLAEKQSRLAARVARQEILRQAN